MRKAIKGKRHRHEMILAMAGSPITNPKVLRNPGLRIEEVPDLEVEVVELSGSENRP
jgi:hypothetical protein